MFETKKLTGKQLSQLLDVAPASLSGAAKKDHLCKGKPVANWAVRNERGKLLEYELPEDKYRELSEPENKPNSAYRPSKQPNKAKTIEPNKANLAEPESLPVRKNVSSIKTTTSDKENDWTGALFAVGLAVGVAWLGEYMQNQNKALKTEIWKNANKANKANKGLAGSQFVHSQNFLPR